MTCISFDKKKGIESDTDCTLCILLSQTMGRRGHNRHTKGSNNRQNVAIVLVVVVVKAGRGFFV